MLGLGYRSRALVFCPQKTFSEMRQSRSIDLRDERPSSAELEQEFVKSEEKLRVEDLQEETQYEPLPEGTSTAYGNTCSRHACSFNVTSFSCGRRIGHHPPGEISGRTRAPRVALQTVNPRA